MKRVTYRDIIDSILPIFSLTIIFYLADFYQLQSLCFEFLHIFGYFEDDVALDGHGDGGW